MKLNVLIQIYRFGNWSYRKKIPFFPKLMRWMIRFLFSADIPSECTIGRNVLFSHMGLGVVLHERSVIGKDVSIGHRVTIGGRSGHYEVPVIKDSAIIGAGSLVLGPVVVGEGAEVGAGAVVLDSVPDHCVVVGIPAKIISKKC